MALIRSRHVLYVMSHSAGSGVPKPQTPNCLAFFQAWREVKPPLTPGPAIFRATNTRAHIQNNIYYLKIYLATFGK